MKLFNSNIPWIIVPFFPLQYHIRRKQCYLFRGGDNLRKRHGRFVISEFKNKFGYFNKNELRSTIVIAEIVLIVLMELDLEVLVFLE